MKINAAFDKRVVVHSESTDWHASPMAGVDRRPLDRVGSEVARATTIVRYAPGSTFSPHVHTGGEEFLVLEGVFQDEHGDFPAGSYIRNPPQSRHTPGSKEGCTIFVKLWQFEPDDRTHVRVRTDKMPSVPHRKHEGISEVPLYLDEHESVSVLHFEPFSRLSIPLPAGAEILVLEGSLFEGDDTLVKNSWMRLPCNSQLNATAGDHGAKVWVKLNHLNSVTEQIRRVESATK